MALKTKLKDTEFAVGDTVRVVQSVQEGDKEREQTFEGMVIGIKGKAGTKTFTVRRIGSQKIGIERIFPVDLPTIKKVSVVKKGLRGVRHAKLYFTRDKSQKEIDKVYSRHARKERSKKEK